jgi:hypothetical protein
LKIKKTLFLQDNLVFFRGLMILGAGLMATFGSTAVHLSGAGPLGCLTIAFIAFSNVYLTQIPSFTN